MILDSSYRRLALLDFQFLVFNFQLLVFIGRFVYGSFAADKHCLKDSKNFTTLWTLWTFAPFFLYPKPTVIPG